MSLYTSYQPLLNENTDTGEVPWDSGIAVGKSDTFVWHMYWFFPDHRFLFNFFLSPPTLAQCELYDKPDVTCFCAFAGVWRIFRSLVCRLLWSGGEVHAWKAEGQMTLPSKLLGAILYALSAWARSLLSLHGLQGKKLVVLHSMWTWYNTHQFAAGSEPSKRSCPCKDAW